MKNRQSPETHNDARQLQKQRIGSQRPNSPAFGIQLHFSLIVNVEHEVIPFSWSVNRWKDVDRPSIGIAESTNGCAFGKTASRSILPLGNFGLGNLDSFLFGNRRFETHSLICV